MRVEIDVQPLGKGFTGISTYLRNLIPELQLRHNDVAIQFVGDHAVPELDPSPISLIGPPITNMKTKLAWEALRLPMHSLVSRPDILHLPYHSATAMGWGRRVITIHDCYLWTVNPTNRAEQIYRSALALAARRAHLVATDSNFSARQIESLLGVDARRIRTIPLACTSDIPRPRDAQELRELRARYRLDRPFILYAGGTAPHKGILSLISAYAALDPDLRAKADLVILGRLDRAIVHHRPILDAIAALAHPGRIIAPGMVPQIDLGAFYQAARVFVFPSFYEGFGLAPLEAMACGTPVIASDRGSIAEVVADAAILIDPAHPETITTALEETLQDDARLAVMSRAGKLRASHFSWQKTADLTRAAYDSTLSL